MQGNFKPSPGLPGQPGSPRLLHRALCPATGFAHLHPFCPSAAGPAHLLFPCPQCPHVSVTTARAVITRSKRFSPLHIFLFLSVRCGKPNRMITQHVPRVCCLLGNRSRNDKWEREESRKHQMAQKAAGQIKSNPAVVLLVLIELQNQETNTQMFHWFVSRQLVKIF